MCRCDGVAPRVAAECGASPGLYRAVPDLAAASVECRR
ncbi:hypothetical protein BSIN_1536 [Burkholderia singularis]|uniref:Uncharacterized protein n=1 Tax=Burkholderia singularis TaxID=1503053 RepID=A0A238GZ58_9BURK|nr:hypothetical protein BSIN_1536 [Burkholderia singularis]